MRLFDFLFGQSRPAKTRGSRRPSPSAPLLVEQLEARTVLDSAQNLAFVQKLYPDLLNRPIEQPTQNVVSDSLDRFLYSRFQEAKAVLGSGEYLNRLVQSFYVNLLGRSADPAGQAGFVAFLAGGNPNESAEAMIAGSDEYFQHAGGTTNGFLDALYQDALGRHVDQSGLDSWTPLLNSGVSRFQVALAIFNSPEAQGFLVSGYYQTFLHRTPGPNEVNGWVSVLQHGAHDQDVLAGILSSDEYAPGASEDIFLAQSEVQDLLNRASAASASNDAIIAVVDRNGQVLGVRVESGVAPAFNPTSPGFDPGAMTFAIDGALALARAAAYFSSDQGVLTSRTVGNLSQSTITQREVQSNPSITDPNSPFAGPGFVAAVGTGGHFPPSVPETPPVDLFGIEATNRDSLLHPGPDGVKTPTDFIQLAERFNADPNFVPPGQELTAPESYGFVSGFAKFAQARGIGTLPGGIPLYKQGRLVGGIGVFFPGLTGFATEENSRLSATFNPALPDRSLEAEYIAFAATGGSAGAGVRFGPLGGVAPLPGFDIPAGSPIYLNGITLDGIGPGGAQGPANLFVYGQGLGQKPAPTGTNVRVDTAGDSFIDGKPVPEGWLVLPHAGVTVNGQTVTAADVAQIINQGIAASTQIRAQIRETPTGSPGVQAQFVFAVADSDGNLLGLYREPDATYFSIDVAVAKARNTAYYDNPAQLQPADQVAGLPPGVSLTSRTFRFLAQPRYPEGIDGTPPGPFSIFNDPGSNPLTGLNVGPPLPASVFQSVLGYTAFHPAANFHDPYNPANQNGVVFFPGSSALYKPVAGQLEALGGFGVSGDGVNQDDVATFYGIAGFTPPTNIRADQFFVGGARLPYQVFSRNATTF
jgi:uncharacterized protein GlcG (DUF336 family)